MKFDELQLDSAILAGVEAIGFEECTPVQAQAIPRVLEGRDVMVQSQTGTGKTAAFLLPAFQLLLHNERLRGSTAIVIAPTRELAVQIKEEADLLAEPLSIRSEVFHGGVGYEHQQRALSEGVNIIVGTPGRIIDLSQSGYMDLRTNGIVVIDEADRLLDMGFYPDLRKMLRRMRPREERVNMLFSATLSRKARNIAWEHMNDPVEIEVEPEQITVDTVKQELYHVPTSDKMSLLLGILERDKPRNAIIFTNTKRAAEEVSRRIAMNGFPTEFISGDLPQRKRIAIIRKLKAGEAEFLVATDVAARGLHIDNLEMVLNYDVPEDPEAYVHRIGRTARAGESGKAVMLACEKYVFGLEAVENFINQKIPVATIDPDMYVQDASAGKRIQLDSGGGGRDRGRDRSRDRPRDRGRDERRGGKRSPRGAHPDRPTDRRDERPRKKPLPVTTHSHSHSGDAPARSRPRRGGEKQKPVGTAKYGDSLEQRLAYYREKYGEDFQPTDEMLANMGESRKKRKRKSTQKRSSRPGTKPSTGEAQPDRPDKDEEKKPGILGTLKGLFGK